MNRDDQDNPYGITLLRFCAQRENPFACKGYATQLCNPKDITMYEWARYANPTQLKRHLESRRDVGQRGNQCTVES